MFQLARSSSGGHCKNVKGGHLLLILKQFSFLQNIIVISSVTLLITIILVCMY